MNTFFSKAAKFFAIIFSIAFIVTLILSTFLYQLEKNAFHPNTYKDALIEEDMYNRLPAVIGDQLVASAGVPCKDNPVACDVDERSDVLERCLEDALGKEAYQSLALNERLPTEAEVNRFTPCFDEYGYPENTEQNNAIPPLAQNLTAKDWEVFLSTLISPEELRQLTEESIDQVLNVLNGDAKTAALPLEQIKDRLRSEKGVEAVFTLLASQPACTTTDILSLGSGKMPYCNPPEKVQNLLKPIIQAQLNLIAGSLPSQQILLRQNNPKSPLLQIQSLRILMRLSPLIPLVLLLFITILVVRSPKTWLRWWGIPLLIAGGITLLLSLLAAPLTQAALKITILGRIPMDVSGSVLQLVYDLFRAVIHTLIENIVVYALVMIITGLTMTLGALFIKKKEEFNG